MEGYIVKTQIFTFDYFLEDFILSPESLTLDDASSTYSYTTPTISFSGGTDSNVSGEVALLEFPRTVSETNTADLIFNDSGLITTISLEEGEEYTSDALPPCSITGTATFTNYGLYDLTTGSSISWATIETDGFLNMTAPALDDGETEAEYTIRINMKSASQGDAYQTIFLTVTEAGKHIFVTDFLSFRGSSSNYQRHCRY